MTICEVILILAFLQPKFDSRIVKSIIKKKSFAFFLLFLIACWGYSQNLTGQLSNTVWVSGGNDALIFGENELSFFNYKIAYTIESNTIIIRNGDKFNGIPSWYGDTMTLGSIEVDDSTLSIRYAEYFPVIEFSNLLHEIIRESFDYKQVFYKKEYNPSLREDVFIEFEMRTFFGDVVTIDSVGNFNIIGRNYSPFLAVNKGLYKGRLPSHVFENFKTYLFKNGFFSVEFLIKELRNNRSCSDCQPSSYRISSKIGTRAFRTYPGIGHISQFFTWKGSSKKSNIRWVSSDDSQSKPHVIHNHSRDQIEEGLTSFSGKLDSLTTMKVNKKTSFIYQFKVDSAYFKPYKHFANQNIFIISDTIIQSIKTVKRYGLTLKPVIVRGKDSRRVLIYYRIIKTFDPDVSNFFDYYGWYYPRGYARRTGPRLSLYPPKFNKFHKKLYRKVKRVD